MLSDFLTLNTSIDKRLFRYYWWLYEDAEKMYKELSI